MIDEKDFVKVVVALKQLAELAKRYDEVLESAERMVREAVLHDSLRVPDARWRFEVPCEVAASLAKRGVMPVVMKAEGGKAVLVGGVIEVIDGNGVRLETYDLRSLRLGELVLLAIMERECGLLSKLAEAAKRECEEMEGYLEKLRRLAGLLGLVLKEG